MFRVTLVAGFLLSSSSADCSFNKRKDGELIYGMNDGGCYFCSRTAGSSIPLSGTSLVETCQQMCEADPLCIAYEISKLGALPFYEVAIGSAFNCCLERSFYPSSVLVDAINDDTNCGKDALCWTRYDKANPTKQSCDVVPPSDLCKTVVDPRSYSVEDIQFQADFINDGCPFDNTSVELLNQARKDCAADLTGARGIGSAAAHNAPSELVVACISFIFVSISAIFM